MKTPDGQEFRAGIAGSPLAAAGSVLLDGLRFLGRALVFVTRAFGKLVATIWRLAGALDAALWRGVKLFARGFWRVSTLVARIIVAASRDFIRWLPSRTGRAYSAFSGFALVIMLLWIVDELRVAPSGSTIAGQRARAPVDLEDPILARIEGRYVHLSEVVSAAQASGTLRDGETLTPQAAFERELVQAYVEQRLLAGAATDDGLQRKPGISRKLSAARDRVLAAAFMEDRIASSVSDEMVEKLYARQVDVTRLGDEVRARHIVVADGAEAAAVVAALDAGGSFEELARELSIDRATAPLGGEIGYFTKDMMTPPLATAAFSTPSGERAAPFETEFGWHILEVLDRRPTNGVPLAAVKDDIRRFLTLRTIASTVSELSEENDVVFYEVELDERPRPPPALRPGGDSGPGGTD